MKKLKIRAIPIAGNMQFLKINHAGGIPAHQKYDSLTEKVHLFI